LPANVRRWLDFYCEWSSLVEAIDHPDLAEYARDDLRLFRGRIG
jgi:hypothetical protein